MITATMRNTAPGKPNLVFALGLNKNNMARLMADQPIWLKLSELDPRLPGELAVLVIGAETDAELTAELHRFAGDASKGEDE